MNNTPCKGCTICCQWSGDLSIRPPLAAHERAKFGGEDGELPAGPGGHCKYLGESGCIIHSDKPLYCQDFDCRKLWKQVNASGPTTFIKVLVKGAQLCEKK